MRLPDLPPAITARVVPVGYAHIAQLLYERGPHTDDVALTKRMSGWRRTDPDFPPALSSGRSPTFDVRDVWRWLDSKARSGDGRVQASLRDMTKLQPNSPHATTERHWLLAGLALRYETGDLRARHWMTALAALRAVASYPTGLVSDQLARHLPNAEQARKLLQAAADAQVTSEAFIQRVAEALPAQPAVNTEPGTTPNPLVALGQYTVPSDLRALAASTLLEVPQAELTVLAESTLASDEGSVSSHLDTTSTSPEAAELIVGLVDALGERLGRRWTTAYDPAVGEGHLLATLASRTPQHPWTLFGQDADAEALQLAAGRLLATGCEFHVQLTPDTLEHDRFRDQRVNVVVADPPQPTRRSRLHQHLDQWWQHIIDKLADDGSMAFVLTSDQPEAQPSDDVIASGHVLAIIETSHRLRRDTPGRTVLWVLTAQEVHRTVRLAAPRELSPSQSWLHIVLHSAPDAIHAVLHGGKVATRDPKQLLEWSVVSEDAELLRPFGPESWPDLGDQGEYAARLRREYVEAVASLPDRLRDRELEELEAALGRKLARPVAADDITDQSARLRTEAELPVAEAMRIR